MIGLSCCTKTIINFASFWSTIPPKYKIPHRLLDILFNCQTDDNQFRYQSVSASLFAHQPCIHVVVLGVFPQKLSTKSLHHSNSFTLFISLFVSQLHLPICTCFPTYNKFYDNASSEHYLPIATMSFPFRNSCTALTKCHNLFSTCFFSFASIGTERKT